MYKAIAVIDTVMLILVAVTMLLGIMRSDEGELSASTMTFFTMGIIGNIFAVALIWL